MTVVEKRLGTGRSDVRRASSSAGRPDDPARRGEWLAEPGYGVYVHVPFCLHRCHYCDFNTYEGQGDLHAAYADALVAEITCAPGVARPATSVFFGGGTPTLLPVDLLARVLVAIEERFGIDRDAEVTIEANPETVDEGVFEGLLETGFDRFSIGVQSLVPRVLEGLGRTHGPERALAAIAAARLAGVTDLNVDLIYGSPWERPEDWIASLEGVIDLEPEHVSAYALTIETHTPLHTLVTTGRVPDVEEDVQAGRHELAAERLAAAGYERYEVSNWAKPNMASRHNLLYWSAGDYAAFGAGAHGHEGGRRWWNTRLPRDYIAAVTDGVSTEAGSELLDPDRRAAEALMLGLRLASGVPAAAFSDRFGPTCLADRDSELSELAGLGLVDLAGGRIRLTSRATLLANEVACRLL